MEIIPDKKELLPLVKKAAAGEILLPEFQRNFVWGRDDIKDLLVSIIKDYFIGTFLLLRADQESAPFAMRPIAGVTKPQEQLRPEWMVLDGQQRVSSLYYVFHNPDVPLRWTKYPYRFFIDLNKIMRSDFDNAIFSERADYCTEYFKEKYQFEEHILPFSEILSWENWRQRFEKYLLEKDKDYFINEYHPKILPVWSRTVDTIRNFQIAVVELPKIKGDDPEQVAEVCAIFEKVNSTGIPLSVFDLLTARLWKYGINLHELWEETLTKYKLISHYSGSGDPEPYAIYILRTIALLRDKEVKSKILITLEPGDFVDDWMTAAQYMEKALKRISSTNKDGFGVTDVKWFPYTTMTPVLAALLKYIEINNLVSEGLKAIKKWYWGSVFTERYAGATDTVARLDFVELCKHLRDNKELPEIFGEVTDYITNNPYFTFRDVSRRNAIYKGVMNLIAIRGAKDFSADDSIEFWELDDHHIFPRAYLAKQRKISEDDRETVLNKTLIASKTNRKISRSKPSDYVSRLIPKKHRYEILSSHLINKWAQNALMNNDYEDFLQRRDSEILRTLKRFLR